MTDAIYAFNVTCPANISVANPVEVALPTPPQVLQAVSIVIPDGHAGLTGIAIGYGHTPVHPDNIGGFISGNGETVPFEVEGDPGGVPWSAFLINNDLTSHSWQVRLSMSDVPTAKAITPPTPLAPAAILAAGA